MRSHQTDLNGVVWHGAYLGIFDDARIETFRQLDYTYARVVAEGWQLAVRHMECDFLAPARMDDLLAITVTVPTMTRATLMIAYQCHRDGSLLARGSNVYVFIDASGKPIRVPPRLVQTVRSFAALLQYPVEMD